MAKRNSTSATRKLTRAGIYLRYSSQQQDGSDAQQQTEIDKLCSRERYQVIATYSDQAITGDSGREHRPGLAALLDAAARGEFDILVAWDLSRIGRQDSADAGETLRSLKQAGVAIHTCREGRIDPRDSMDRLRYAFSAEGANLENRRRAYNCLRGQVDNAKQGNHNGGRFVSFGLDRAQFDQQGRLVRRLKPKQQKDDPRHTVRLIPSEDQDKLAALRYAFKRYAEADIGLRSLAQEMNSKGFPSPTSRGWSHQTLGSILRNPIYRGSRRWGAKAAGKYHTCQGADIVARETYSSTNGSKPTEDAILADGVATGIIPAKLFDAVKRKLARQGSRKITRRAEYPLSGLVYCTHCGKPMYGKADRKDARTIFRYVCSTYTNSTDSTCTYNWVDADRLLAWLIPALQQVFLGPGRAELVEQITKQLKAATKGSRKDTSRLQKRLAGLDREIGNLVKLARTAPDIDELAQELGTARTERERIRVELAKAGQSTASGDIAAQARQVADRVWRLGELLPKAEPATLRESLREMVSRIDCRWEDISKPGAKRRRSKLVGGEVLLRQHELFTCLFGAGKYAEA